MKKKLLTLTILVLLTISSLAAAITDVNRQEIVSIDSPIYRAMKNLYISQGLALPSTTGPWTMAELDMMLERLTPPQPGSPWRETYEYLVSEIGHEPRIEPQAAEGIFGFTISADVALDGYYHTNPTDFGDVDMWGDVDQLGDFNTPTPLLSIPLETWFGNNIYGYASFDLGANRTFNDKSGQTGSNWYTNILMVPPSAIDDLNLNFPYRAFGSIGGDWWNISIGRDKLRWGPGESGNLTISDQIPYHNNARFTAFSKVFKYTFSISSFIHPMNYTDDKGNLSLKYSQNAPRKGLSMFIAHRLEWRIFDKVNMALTESIMYQSEDNQFDFLVLSPTAIFHNYYIRSNANSLLSFEFDWTFVDHWNLYGEAVVDEFKLPGEFTEDGPPSAYGFILGLKTSYPAGGGMFYGSLEGAYTYPYLYLRDDGASYGDPSEQPSYGYGINFIVATPEFTNKNANYTLDYLGYGYGNDSLVGNLILGYEKYGKWSIEGDFTYWADGCMDMNSKWVQTTPGVDDPSAPTDEPDMGTDGDGGTWDSSDTDYEKRNAVAHWFIFTLRGSWTIVDKLDLTGQVRYVNVLNFGNMKGEKADDIQVSVGLSYSF